MRRHGAAIIPCVLRAPHDALHNDSAGRPKNVASHCYNCDFLRRTVNTPSIPVPASGLSFADLYEHEGLARLDALFLERLGEADPALCAALRQGRADPGALAPKQESELLIAAAPHLDDFLAWLFGIEAEVEALSAQHHELAPIFGVKRNFVQRKAMHKIKAAEAETLDGEALARQIETSLGEPLTELSFSRKVVEWQKDEAAN